MDGTIQGARRARRLAWQWLAVCGVCGACALANGAAAAATYSFYGITNNHAANTASGTAQLFVDVTDPDGSENVEFTFRNTGPLASSITDIYFDDGTLLAIATITNGPAGVSFSQSASPGNLPGGNDMSPKFSTTQGFSADSDPPVQPNGVNPGEWMRILFDLQSSGEYSDVISDLASGALRIGIHVQGFSNGGSESFVNNPVGGPGPSLVPESSSTALLLAGLAMVAGLARVERRKTARSDRVSLPF